MAARHLLATASLALVVVACASGSGSSSSGSSGGGSTSSSGSSGSSGSSSGEPSDPKMNGFVAAHNKVRAGAQPAPTPALTPLSWSDEDAKVAQSWANGCVYKHNPNTGGRGENIFASAGASNAEFVVKAWADEAASYDYATNTCGKVCGHYTQIVWSTTKTFGCGMKACSTGSPFSGFPNWELWVCDYSPPGNYVGKKPY